MKRYGVGLLLVFTWSGWTAADQVLTWEDCIRQAAQNNPDLLSALQAMESSRASYKGSFNGILPHLSVSNSYSDSSFTSANTANITGTSESKVWTAEGTASLDLIDFGQWASIQSASAFLHQSQANVYVAATNVLLALYKSFANVLFAQEEIQVNTAIRDTWKVNAQMINLRYESGSESKGNNMNTEAQYLQAEINLDQASRDLHVAQQQLNQSIGVDHFTAWVVTGTWSAPPVPMPRPDFNALLDKHPQILAQQAVVEQARAGINLAHSTLWPTLSLSYNKGTQGGSELPTNPFWTFTGVLNYPLFGSGLTSTYYASAAAQRTYDKSRQDLRSLRNQLSSNLESSWSAYALAQDEVRVQHAFLDAAKQRKDESDVRYQSGLMTFEEWILVVQDYVNFQTSFLRAEQNLILTEAQWRFATGEQLGAST
jgi:outer membrane protein